MQNPFQMIQMFNQYKANFQGDPKKMVEDLLRSGKMSQQEFNELQKTATEFQKMLGNLKM